MKRITRKTILIIFILCSLFSGTATGGVSHDGTTLVLAKSQIPADLAKFNATQVYVLFYSGPVTHQYPGNAPGFIRNDTILNLTTFRDSAAKWSASVDYRLIFAKNGLPDSIYECNLKYYVYKKSINLGNGLLLVELFDAQNKVSEKSTIKYKNLNLRGYSLFETYVLTPESKSVWMLSIGIDNYGERHYNACKSDAWSYLNFFKDEYSKLLPADSAFHSYYLPDSLATKKNILSALQDIARKARYDDYFIFNFSGESNIYSTDSVNFQTYFFPYNITGSPDQAANRYRNDTTGMFDNMLSLKTIQEYIQQINANNQLFISEAGPSAKFKTEFIKSLMQNSASVASILNKNRIIIIPNNYGMEGLPCNARVTPKGYKPLTKGYINDFITSLDTSKENIYNLFDEAKSKPLATELKMKQYGCRVNLDYFDIFFEREFLQQYREIFGDAAKTRGATIASNELNSATGLTGRRYALVIGTNHYKAKDWPTLTNPIFDAQEVASQLRDNYGFEVRQLYDKPSDSIYSNIAQYYRALKKEDQFIIYIAGHGDFDRYLLDDGFVVCADSKPVAEDPMRNTYIQHSKLKKMINKLPSNQTLVLLDICFGGTFDENILGNKRENKNNTSVNANVLQLLSENSKYKIRRVLSSTGVQPAFDGAAGMHSPFANLLLQVLKAKGAGKNGIVMLSDVFAVLQTASLNEGVLRITPYKASFGDDEPLGEFILIPQEKPADKLALTKP